MTKTIRTAKEDSEQMYDMVKGGLWRAWYGVKGHEWTATLGVDVTSDVRDLADKRCKINSYNINFGDPAPGQEKILVVECIDRVLNLGQWFKELYLQGHHFTCWGFERIAAEAVYHHKASDIKVWQDALDLSQGCPETVVLFHYTDYIGFQNITAPEKQAAEIWASLYTHDDGKNQANAWYGKGAYATAKGPDVFYAEYTSNTEFYKAHKINSTADLIVDNNFRKMALRDGFNQYVPKVKFCIPLIARKQDAYDVAVRQTPEMRDSGVEPGYNLKGNKMNEEGKPVRDQWVMRVESEGAVSNARATLLDVLKRRVEKGGGPMAMARLAFVLDSRGLKPEAAELYKKCYVARKNLYYSEHQDVLNAQSNYAYSLTQLGRYAEAEPIQKDNYERTQKKFGDKHRSTLISLRNWAYTIMHLGKCEDALSHFQKAYDLSKGAFGEGDPDTMRNLGGLSACLKECGKGDQALDMKKQRYDQSKKRLGPHHPDTLTALGNYGVALSQAGQNLEAEEFKRMHYEACKSFLGERHPDTLSSMGNWAESLRKLGRRQEAVVLQQQRHDISCEILGPEHESTLVAKTNLAVGLGQDHPQYEPLLRAVYDGRLKALGKDHPATKRALKNWETTQ